MAGPVVIVGGGIGGLSAGLALLHHGIECTIHEQAPELNEIGAGVSLWPAPLRVFDRLGLGDEVRSLAEPWADGGLRLADGRFLVRYTADDLARRLGEPSIGVHRGELQALLVRTLPAGVLHTGQRCLGVDLGTTPADGATARFEDGAVHGRAIVAADGRRSVIRRQLFGDRPRRDAGCVGWRGTAAKPVDFAADAFAGETWGPRGRFGFLPIDGARTTWFATARHFVDGGSKAELLERFGGYHEPIGQLIEATPEDQIWRDRIDDLWPLRRWSKGAVTLLGDAAHPMTPELGQGACQAILDGWALARALATEPDLPTAFGAYERARRRRTGMVTLVARAAAAGGRLEGGAVSALRNRVMRLTPASALVRQLDFVAREGWRRTQAEVVERRV